MQIDIIGVAPHLTPQTRAYAEYRVFSRLAPLGPDVRTVLVTVTRSSGSDITVCAVSADLGRSGSVRTRARHPHPTGAIDAAAERLAEAASRRLRAAPAL